MGAVRGQNGFPLARGEGLLAEEVGAETVLYDGRSREAHCLTPLAAVVFARADGRTSPADLAAIASAELGDPVDVELVEQALAELEARDLLVEPPSGDGISRRQMFGRTAKVGGAALAAPLVYSVLTPAYGVAATPPPPGTTPLSHVIACFTCDNTPGGATAGTYSMKWEWNDTTGAVVEACGAGDTDQTCGCYLTCAESGGGASNACLPDSTIQENSDGTVTFTFPTNCEITDFVLKGNCNGAVIRCDAPPNQNQCLNPAGDVLPSGGNQSDGVYKTTTACT